MCQARSLAPSQPQGIPRLLAAVVGATSTHGLCSLHKVQHRTQGWGYSLGLDGVAGEAQPLTPSQSRILVPREEQLDAAGVEGSRDEPQIRA